MSQTTRQHPLNTFDNQEPLGGVTGTFCMNCECFQDHTTPVDCGFSTTGRSGCPDCLEADPVRRVVECIGDERSVTGGYIPPQHRTHGHSLTLDAALAIVT